jgi:outer membrane protein W
MRKKLLFFVSILLLPAFLFANDEKKEKNGDKSIGVRLDRKFALTVESGFNSLAGLGLNASYYTTPNLAIDGGLGLGLQGFKGGLRARYLFTTKKFAPYIGGGLMYAPLSVDGVEIKNDNTGELFLVDLKPSFYGQIVAGFEYMSNGGFVIGMNLGYAPLLNDNVETSAGSQELSGDSKTIFNILYGSGLVVGFNMGYSF